MNAQIRRLFAIVLLMFCVLGLAASNAQFFQAGRLNADTRNSRNVLQASEHDRGPIIVGGNAIASSSLQKGGTRYQRSYAQGPLYAGVTGYFSSTGGTSRGLEKSADDILRGDTSQLFVQRVRNMLAGRQRQGGGIVLTLDASLQRVARRALGDRRGAVVVLDAKTGAIRAMYSSPSYDPNPLSSLSGTESNSAYEKLVSDPARPLLNRAIEGDLYPPGSTFKLLTTTALLEHHVATPSTHLDSPVSITLPGTRTTLANIEQSTCGNGKPTLAEAFARSCNTTFALASEKLTYDDLNDVAERFGFGQDLEIPLSVTSSTFPQTTNAAELALSAIGQQSVAVTPLQMAMVAQAIANGGHEMRPYLIDSIVDADLQEREKTSAKELGTPISTDIADQLRELMLGVVDKSYGSGTSMAISGVQVAAKTGTAEDTDSVTKRANTDAWAVGFAPANDPELAFAVVVEGDRSNPYPHGGIVAGPIARALLVAGLQR